jgi:hypothetical protein
LTSSCIRFPSHSVTARLRSAAPTIRRIWNLATLVHCTAKQLASAIEIPSAKTKLDANVSPPGALLCPSGSRGDHHSRCAPLTPVLHLPGLPRPTPKICVHVIVTQCMRAHDQLNSCRVYIATLRTIYTWLTSLHRSQSLKGRHLQPRAAEGMRPVYLSS